MNEIDVWVTFGLDARPGQLRLEGRRIVLASGQTKTPLIDAELGTITARRLRSGVISLDYAGRHHVVLFFAPLPDTHISNADKHAREWVKRVNEGDALSPLDNSHP